MTRTRYKIIDEDAPHFLTCTIVGWTPIFSFPGCTQVILDSWRFLQKRKELRIHGYVIMENHLHWIAESANLQETVTRFKSFTARRIIDLLAQWDVTAILSDLRRQKPEFKTDQNVQLWQEGSHPQQIINDKMMIQKLEYIHNNPVRRGYVDDPTHWRYSSARNYEGLKGLIEVDMDW
jgi:REP element-mobilizing transposase RayT